MRSYSRAGQAALLPVSLALAFCAGSASAADAPFAFTKVIGNTATLPIANPPASFFFEGGPILDGPNVAFLTARNTPEYGLFVTDGTGVSKIIDRNTALPNGAGPWRYVLGPSRDGAATTFSIWDDVNWLGVYRSTGGTLGTVVDQSTSLPAWAPGGNTVTIQRVFGVSSDAGLTAFQALTLRSGSGASGQGVYTDASGSFKPLVDHTTPVPGVPGALFSSVSTPITRRGKVAFSAPQFTDANFNLVPGQAIFTADPVSGALRRVMDLSTPKPGGGTFGDLVKGPGDVLTLGGFDGANTVFQVTNTKAIFAEVGGVIRTIADTNTLIPGTTTPFSSFGQPTIDDGRVVFNDAQGIFVWDDGALSRILSRGDTVDGKTVSFFSFANGSLEGDRLAVQLTFGDGSSGIYLTQVPEPAALGLTAGLCVAGLVRRRRPHHRD